MAEGARNRVLVGVPERLRKANASLRRYETLVGYLRQELGNRGADASDSEILDLMANLIGRFDTGDDEVPRMEVASPYDFQRMKERGDA